MAGLADFDAVPQARPQPPAWYRGPRRSKLRARVDLLVLLYGSDELVALRGLPARRVTWTRNRPAVADELSVTLDSDTLPFDLRLIAAADVTCWLYEHQDVRRCRIGDPGMFAGRMDRIRRNRKGDVEIEARDFTGALLDAKLGGAQLARVDLTTAPSLVEVCRSLLRLVPHTETWSVEAVGVAGGFSTLGTYSRREEVRPKGEGAPGASPAKALHRRRSTITTLLKGDKVSAWEAICKICALLGAVPEIDIDPHGVPRLRIIDALAVQSSDLLRPFARGDQRERQMVVGYDVAMLEETLELGSADSLPDFVRVTTLNPDTGRAVSAVYPDEAASSDLTAAQYAKWLEESNGLQLVADGLASWEGLHQLARAAFEDARKNELTMTVTTWQTWSTGGSPDDPDLLALAAGAAMRLRFTGVDRLDTTPVDLLRRRGLPPEAAAAVARAQERVFAGTDSLLFQVDKVVHTLVLEDQPSYDCEVGLRTFLGGRSPRV